MSQISNHVNESTVLAASASFTSSDFESQAYSKIVGSVFSDQAGTAYVEQSFDGVNFDISDSFAVTANVGVKISLDIVAPYVRGRYVNGAAAQTAFRFFVGGLV